MFSDARKLHVPDPSGAASGGGKWQDQMPRRNPWPGFVPAKGAQGVPHDVLGAGGAVPQQGDSGSRRGHHEQRGAPRRASIGTPVGKNPEGRGVSHEHVDGQLSHEPRGKAAERTERIQREYEPGDADGERL